MANQTQILNVSDEMKLNDNVQMKNVKEQEENMYSSSSDTTEELCSSSTTDAGGQQLAVMTDQVPLTVEQQVGVPHGAEGVVALFADTDGEEDLILTGDAGNAIESRTGNGYGVLKQALIEGVLIHGRDKQAPEGEGGDEGLRENNDIGAVFLSFLCLCRHLLDGSVTIQEYRGGLNSGSAQLGHGITNKGNFAHFHLSAHF